MGRRLDWELAAKRELVWSRGPYNRGTDVRSGDEFVAERVPLSKRRGARLAKPKAKTKPQPVGVEPGGELTPPYDLKVTGSGGTLPSFSFVVEVATEFEDRLLEAILAGERIPDALYRTAPSACQSFRDRFFAAATKAYLAKLKPRRSP